MGLSGDNDPAVCLHGQTITPFGIFRRIIFIDAACPERRIRCAFWIIFQDHHAPIRWSGGAVAAVSGDENSVITLHHYVIALFPIAAIEEHYPVIPETRVQVTVAVKANHRNIVVRFVWVGLS